MRELEILRHRTSRGRAAVGLVIRRRSAKGYSCLESKRKAMAIDNLAAILDRNISLLPNRFFQSEPPHVNRRPILTPYRRPILTPLG
jgi:hypothetical protein